MTLHRASTPRAAALGLLLSALLGLTTPHAAHCQGSWVNLTNGDYVKGIGGHAGVIWLVTNGGAVRLEKATGQRVFLTRADSGLPTNQPNSLHVAANGDCWVLAGTLSRFDGAAWTSPSVPFQPSKILTDNAGALWIHDWWNASSRHLAKLAESGWQVLDTSSCPIGLYATGVVRDHQSNLWVAVYPRYYFHEWRDGGLARYDGTSWTSYTLENGSLPSNFVSSLALDQDGSLWLAYHPAYPDLGAGVGLSRYDGANWTHYRMDNFQLPTADVRGMTIDHLGIKWLATDVGVVRFDGTGVGIYDTSNSALPSNDIVQIYLDDDDQVWAGTRDAGLATLVGDRWTAYDTSNSPFPFSRSYNQLPVVELKADGRGGIWMALANTLGGLLWISGDQWNFYDRSNSPLPTNQIFDLAPAADGKTWIATPYGLVAFDGSRWTIYTSANSELRQDYAYCVAVDPASGKVWVGNQSGLAAFDGLNWTHFDTSNSPLPSNSIEALAVDALGTLFVSTRNGGNFGIVLRFDGSDWAELIRTSYEVPDHLVVDSSGALWTAWPNWGYVPEGGIVRIDSSGPTFFNTGNSGLPEDSITDLAYDGRDLWVGTYSRGVARFDGVNWTVFNMQNSGLAQNAIGAVGIGVDGRVWIGGSYNGGGLSIYTPAGPPVPIFVADLRAERKADGVRLSWTLGKERSLLVGVEVERAPTHEGPYERRTTHLLEPAPSMLYEDREAHPAAAYWYRIVVVGSDGARSLSPPVGVSIEGSGRETALCVPVQLATDLVQLRYSISGARVPVKLQIFDIAGRSVATFDQGLLGDGNYLQPWRKMDGCGRSVARGVYVVRLTAGGTTASQKLIVAR